MAADDGDDDDEVTSLKDVTAAAAASVGNESQVITQIVEEYEQRLQAQLALAKEDIVNALEVQIKVGVLVMGDDGRVHTGLLWYSGVWFCVWFLLCIVRCVKPTQMLTRLTLQNMYTIDYMFGATC